MSIIAVMTNCALIAMSSPVQNLFSFTTSPVHYVICFVAIEVCWISIIYKLNTWEGGGVGTPQK